MKTGGDILFSPVCGRLWTTSESGGGKTDGREEIAVMGIVITRWERGYGAEALARIADLWNRNATRRHGFYPWNGALLNRVFLSGNMEANGVLVGAWLDERLVGFIHVSAMDEPFYPRAGAVEALLVDEPHRGRGIGASLLAEGLACLETSFPGLEFVDAMGAWPCGFLYTVLSDGSERSGVFSDEEGLAGIFRRFGFEPVRESLVMRADPTLADPRPFPGARVDICRRREDSWLDRVFRARELWNHNLHDARGALLSRAIFGQMPGESLREGKTLFSLFGVNTPARERNRGYAGVNLSLMMRHIADLGGDGVELHVYADNKPALAVYRGLGFTEVASTTMMRRHRGKR